MVEGVIAARGMFQMSAAGGYHITGSVLSERL